MSSPGQISVYVKWVNNSLRVNVSYAVLVRRLWASLKQARYQDQHLADTPQGPSLSQHSAFKPSPVLKNCLLWDFWALLVSLYLWVELLVSLNKNRKLIVKFGFQISSESFFSVSMGHASYWIKMQKTIEIQLKNNCLKPRFNWAPEFHLRTLVGRPNLDHSALWESSVSARVRMWILLPASCNCWAEGGRTLNMLSVYKKRILCCPRFTPSPPQYFLFRQGSGSQSSDATSW